MKRYKQSQIEQLADILKKDGVISVPTDTVYGICARIGSYDAYKKLATIKKRPTNQSFPIMCCSEQQVKSIAIVDRNAERLIRAFMPGPITLVLKKKKEALSYINNRGEKATDELAVRIAPLDILKELIEKVGSPIFMTSANLHGMPICKTLEEIEETCKEIDGLMEGDVLLGEASTIVDCTTDEIKIQRQGPISKEEIIKVLEEEKELETC